MITTALLTVLYYFVYAITSPIRLFDNVIVNTSISNALDKISGGLSIADEFIPLDMFFYCLILLLATETVIMIYKITMWIIKKIPGIS